ncbi:MULTISPECIES: type II toxin-antitoxin system VapC family toxin [Methanobacterium]|uniref:PIN domain-containing protein n=1 Tax=Methanobacterium bryantii TaxID=2161 RepID=A0A2A2H6D9_METBR|nr:MULTISPECIES: type II toxin-antitoxin system VapC family toxin [Methanobacterium]OEC85814.1 hypothetical protein A9507_12270 [Methanobacterium sp. A39]PAV05031.1 hypothetical protein ASJ80_12065 [Methanobacterium bryantii]
MNSFFYLDTNICIDRLFGNDSKAMEATFEKMNNANELCISEYVVGEFIRTVLFDCCALHTIILEEENMTDVYRRIRKMCSHENKCLNRKGSRYNLILKNMDYPAPQNRRRTLAILSNDIRFLKKKFSLGLRVLPSSVNCKLPLQKPKKDNGRFKIEIHCESNFDKVNCSLKDFMSNELSFLQTIASGSGINEAFEDLRELISKISDGSLQSCALSHCKLLGDSIILKDCPSCYTLISRDYHLKLLSDIIGQKADYIEKAEKPKC